LLPEEFTSFSIDTQIEKSIYLCSPRDMND
jgi:hypothetical protein